MELLDELMAPIVDAAEDEGEITIRDEEEQDAEPLKVARDPKLPSEDDVGCHRCSHIPFRSWCRWCVMGRGRGDPHLTSAGSSIPIVGLDYFYIDDESVTKREELGYEKDAAGEAAWDEERAADNLLSAWWSGARPPSASLHMSSHAKAQMRRISLPTSWWTTCHG